MKVVCSKCLPQEEIEIPDFTEAEKKRLLKLVTQSAMQSIKYITDTYAVNYRDAKFIVNHINQNYAHCNRCNFYKLKGEHALCPKCKALNFNWES